MEPSGTGNVPAITYAYDAAGAVTEVARQGTGAVTTDVTYDTAGQLTTLAHTAGANVIEAFDVTRDVRGYPTRVDTTTAQSTTTALYGFDVAGRVKSECYPTAGETCLGQSERTDYTYDRLGNRLTAASRTLVGGFPVTTTTEYAYDSADQLLTETVGDDITVQNTWTENGTLESSTTDDGTATYASDLTDELHSAWRFSSSPEVQTTSLGTTSREV